MMAVRLFLLLVRLRRRKYREEPWSKILGNVWQRGHQRLAFLTLVAQHSIGRRFLSSQVIRAARPFAIGFIRYGATRKPRANKYYFPIPWTTAIPGQNPLQSVWSRLIPTINFSPW